MKLTITRDPAPVHFQELDPGEYFMHASSSCVFLKTETKVLDTKGFINAVNIMNGLTLSFEETDECWRVDGEIILRKV